MTNQTKKILSIAQKIFLVAASFSLPIAVLAWLVVANINEFINFAAWETKGNAYQRPLEALLEDIQDHQRLARRCAKDADCPSQIAAAKERIDQSFQLLMETDKKYGVDLEFTGEGLGKRGRQLATAQNLQKGWQELSAMATQPMKENVPADVDGKYDSLVSTIRTMITHAGDTSKLILDPDLDTYYIMDVTLLALPQNQERIARVMAYGRDVILRGAVTSQERTQLAVFAAMLQEADRDRVAGSLKTALNEDQNFYGVSDSFQQNIPPDLKNYEDAVTRLIEMTKSLAGAEGVRIGVEDYIAAAVKARQESFKLWRISADEMDHLLSVRIASYARRRMMAFVFSGLALLIASGIAYRLARSIADPLRRLARTLTPGATLLSSTVGQIDDASRAGSQNAETTRMICEELNAHADDMRKTARELEVLVFGHEVHPS